MLSVSFPVLPLAMARSTPSLYVSCSAHFYARSPQSPGPFPLACNTLRAYRFNTSCLSPPSHSVRRPLSSRSLSFTLLFVLRHPPPFTCLYMQSQS
ncbi:hypothetical protein EDB85DRAFT_1953224 [Lactarius pseudohatsudake]|nr:hypothetical protein EDB85DRAFT_1953224 [Lactarius pseudohatsudake]